MISMKFPRGPILIFTATLVICLLMGITSFHAFDTQPTTSPQPNNTATNPWFELQQKNPYPYTLPLALPNRTILDGTYTKFELKETPPVPCKRCPDYLPEGGIWKLSLSKGVFRIYHPNTGWKSVGTFFVTRDPLAELPRGQLILVNDPVCPDLIGLYHYAIEDKKLVLTVIEDPCSSRLRAANFTNLPWLSCQPPGQEAAISGHWPEPAGCKK